MESCNTFKNLLIYFDYLVKPYEFKLHNDKRNGTICGGIFSLILLSVLTFYFVVTIQQLQTQDNKNYTTYIDSSQKCSDQIKVTENEIQLAFFISIENSLINQEQQNIIIREYMSNQSQQSPFFKSKSSIKLLHIQKNDNQVLQNSLQIIECSYNSDSKSQISQYFSSVKYPIFCLSGSFELQNQFYQTNYTYLSFQFDFDNNDLASIFPNSNIYLNMIYNDDSYQVSGTQFQQSPNYQYKQLQFLKNTNMNYLQNYQMVNLLRQQQGTYFLPSSTSTIGKGARVQKQENLILNQSDRANISITVNVNSNIFIYQMQVKEFQMIIINSLSLLGGLFTALFSFGSFMYQYYYQHIMYQNIMNETFVYDLGTLDSRYKSQQESHSQYQTQHSIFKDFTFKVEYNFILFTLQKIKFFLKKLLNLIKSKENNFVDQCYRDFMLFQKSRKEVEKNLDLVYITKKLFEVEKLKMLLLNKDQLLIFNSLVTPVIQINENKSKNNFEVQVPLQDYCSQKGISTLHETNKIPNVNSNRDIKQIRCSLFYPTISLSDTKQLLDSYQKISDKESKRQELELIFKQLKDIQNEVSSPDKIQKQGAGQIRFQIDYGKCSSAVKISNHIYKMITSNFLDKQIIKMIKLNQNIYQIINFQNTISKQKSFSNIKYRNKTQKIKSQIQKKEQNSQIQDSTPSKRIGIRTPSKSLEKISFQSNIQNKAQAHKNSLKLKLNASKFKSNQIKSEQNLKNGNLNCFDTVSSIKTRNRIKSNFSDLKEISSMEGSETLQSKSFRNEEELSDIDSHINEHNQEDFVKASVGQYDMLFQNIIGRKINQTMKKSQKLYSQQIIQDEQVETKEISSIIYKNQFQFSFINNDKIE
ncbi:hypothetical protein ABPG72_016852 [Tetrahymena utriculariae]